MSNMYAFLESVKTASVDAVNASKPFALALGKVTSVSPLKVRIDQKLELTSAQLMLTNAVREHTVEITPEGGERKRYTLHYGLKNGEQLLLLRCNGGQKFIILDRVEALT